MSGAPGLLKVRIGKRTYSIRTMLSESQVRRLESFIDSFVPEEEPGRSQEERLVLTALYLAYAVEEAMLGLERLGGSEGNKDGTLFGG